MAAAAKGETVYIVEGEKDVHAVEAAGARATCNPGGAGKWQDGYAESLRGAHVKVVADRDDAAFREAVVDGETVLADPRQGPTQLRQVGSLGRPVGVALLGVRL